MKTFTKSEKCRTVECFFFFFFFFHFQDTSIQTVSVDCNPSTFKSNA